MEFPGLCQEIVHHGNEAELKRYMDENREQLEAEAKQIRLQATQALETSVSMPVPVTNRQWLDWMEENDGELQEYVRSATQVRRAFNARLEVQSQAYPAADRIYPPAPACRLAWAAPLLRSEAGFFCLQFGESFLDKLVVYACGLKRQVWAFSLTEVDGRMYSFDAAVPLCQSLKPLESLLKDLGLEAKALAVNLYKLEMGNVAVASGIVKLVVQRATAVETVSRLPDSESESEGELPEASSSDCQSVLSDIESAAVSWINLHSLACSDCKAHGPPDFFRSVIVGAPTNVESFQGWVTEFRVRFEAAGRSPNDDKDSAAGEESAEEGLDEQKDPEAQERHERGSLVVNYNNYFTLSRYPNAGVRIRLLPRWLPVLGSHEQSKHYQISEFGAEHVCYLVCRAWMLGRIKNYLEVPSRKKWFDRELCKLQSDIAKLGVCGGGTGVPTADAAINDHLSEALQLPSSTA